MSKHIKGLNMSKLKHIKLPHQTHNPYHFDHVTFVRYNDGDIEGFMWKYSIFTNIGVL